MLKFATLKVDFYITMFKSVSFGKISNSYTNSLLDSI